MKPHKILTQTKDKKNGKKMSEQAELDEIL
jgi:hypothetical protein